jgi:23S rRNA (guanosine2251-2'-O)-methyltransferase
MNNNMKKDSGKRSAGKPRSRFSEKTGSRSSRTDSSTRKGQGSLSKRPLAELPDSEQEFVENRIEGKNPVLEALRSGRTVEKLLVARGSTEGPVREIIGRAREKGIVVQQVERQRLDEISDSGAHQGVIAYVTPYRYAEVDEIIQRAREKGEAAFLIILDEITDPHNLGAIIRTAECCGAHGVIIPKRRSAGLTPAAVKASAGAVEYMPVAKVTNLARLLDDLKTRGIWIAGADLGEDALPYTEQDYTVPIALVIGSEGRGIGRLVREKCDFLAAIPLKGRIESLNASVAAGILMYEVARQRG